MTSKQLSGLALIPRDQGIRLCKNQTTDKLFLLKATLAAISALFAAKAAPTKPNRKDSEQTRIKPLLFQLIVAFYLSISQNVAVADTANIEVISLQNRPAAEVQAVLAPFLEAGEVVSGNGFQLIVKASPARLESILPLIQRLDSRVHNLLVSVIQNSYKTAAQLNAEASISTSPSGIGMHGLNADTRNIANKRHAQQLRTLEGQAAHIQIGQIRPIDNVMIYGSGYGYSGVDIHTRMQEASSGFAVIPRLQANNEVLLDITPWSERFLRNGAITGQQIQTSIKARLGEWIEIGGITHSQKTQRQGFSGMNYTTRNHESRILIKVELAD